MKKTAYLSLCLALILSLFACGKVEPQVSDGEGMERHIFDGKVLEVSEKDLLVSPLEEEEEFKTSDKISVSLENLEISFDVKAGDIISIDYDGHIETIYPATLGKVFEISFKEEGKLTLGEKLGVKAEDVSEFKLIKHSFSEEEEVILKEAEAVKVCESFFAGEVTASKENLNPITGGMRIYKIKLTDGREITINDYGYLEFEDGKYTYKDDIMPDLGPDALWVKYTLNEKGERVSSISYSENPSTEIGEDVESLEDLAASESYEERVTRVFNKVKAMGSDDHWSRDMIIKEEDGSFKITVYEKDRKFLDDALLALEKENAKEAGLMEKIIERRPCRFSINEQREVLSEFEGIKGLGPGIVLEEADKIMLIVQYRDEADKKAQEEAIEKVIEKITYPRDLIKIEYTDLKKPNPSTPADASEKKREEAEVYFTIGEEINVSPEDVKSLDMVWRSGNWESTLKLEGKEAEETAKSILDNKIKIYDESKNPPLGGENGSYLLNLKDGRRININRTEFVTFKGVENNNKYITERVIFDVDIPESSDRKDYYIENGRRGAEVIKPQLPKGTVKEERKTETFEDLLKNVILNDEHSNVRERYWQSFNIKGEGNSAVLEVWEKKPYYLDDMAVISMEKYPQFKAYLKGNIVRHQCRLSHFDEVNLCNIIEGAEAFKSGKCWWERNADSIDTVQVNIDPRYKDEWRDIEEDILKLSKKYNYPDGVLEFKIKEKKVINPSNYPVNPS